LSSHDYRTTDSRSRLPALSTEDFENMIDVQQRGLVSICRMTHGKATALDVELCGAFTAQLEAHRHAPTHALALIGHGEIFSPRSISCASCRGSRRAVPGQLASSGRVEP